MGGKPIECTKCKSLHDGSKLRILELNYGLFQSRPVAMLCEPCYCDLLQFLEEDLF